MKTYTIEFENGMSIEGLSLEGAAIELLTHDRAEYDIRQTNNGWELWTKTQGLNWGPTVVATNETDFEKAEADIYQQVVDFQGYSGGWISDAMVTHDPR